MSNYEGGEMIKDWTTFFWGMFWGAVVGFFLTWAAMVWGGIATWELKRKSGFDNNQLGSTYDLSGNLARKIQLASNSGSAEGYGNREHLVGSYDRPVGWVPGLYTNLPNGWDSTMGKSGDGPTFVAQPAPTGVAPAVSSMVPNNRALTGDQQLNNALNLK